MSLVLPNQFCGSFECVSGLGSLWVAAIEPLSDFVAPLIDGVFLSLGTFEFSAESKAAVEISNEGADGHVIVDAVQFVRQ